MTVLGLDVIPGYVVHEQLATSLVTTTFLASRASDGYPVMLELHNDPPRSLADVELFRAAIEAVAAVRHPVIPSIREIGEVNDRLYEVTSAVEGVTVDSALREHGPLPRADALAVCTELADALDMLADAGVVHGAIGPLTVWLNDRTRAPSAPFVSLRGHGTVPPSVAELAPVGALPPPDDLRYLAPEQLRGAAPTRRSDQYALACLTLHCLTGAPPFDRPSLDGLVRARQLTAPGDDELHAAELDPAIVAGLRRALAKDPAERFPTCLELAQAIGGGTDRSWSWMADEPDQAPDGHRAIDIADPAAPATGDGRPAHDGHRVAWSDNSSGTRPPLTGRSLEDVDPQPGSATSTGPRRPVRPAAHAAGTHVGADAAPPDGRRARGGLLRSQPARWALFAVLLALVVVAALVTGRRLTAQPSAEAAGGAAGATTERQASWREAVTDAPLTHLATFDDELVGAVGGQLIDVDQATAQERWRTSLDGDVTGLSTMGDVVIAHVDGGHVGVDRTSGDVVWRSTTTDLPPLDGVVTGRGRMFGVSTTGGQTTVHAIDPRTGELGWSIEDTDEDAGAGPVGISFDASERGQRTLYVMQGDVLTAYDTTTREPRWRVAIDGGRPGSLTTLAGAVLVLTDDGRLCRYDAEDGRPTWGSCAALQRADGDARIVSARDGRVIVAGANEVLSVDFTSGRRQWRITTDQPLQPTVTTNPSATYIAAADGTIEAIGQRDGTALWETAPFGEVTAMAAADEAVFVATEDGRLTRLEAPEG
jgi:serine/threonine protein kinase/outer membrane protein assembly factor BamB